MAETEVDRLFSEGKSIYRVTNKTTGKSSYTTAPSISSQIKSGDKSDTTARLAATKSTAYVNSNGEYTEPSISFDDKGNVRVVAPKSVLDTDTFKKNYLDNSVLSQLSQAQKADPSRKFTYSDNSGEHQATAQEILDRYNDEIKDLTKNVEEVNKFYRPMAAQQVGDDKAGQMTFEQLVSAYSPTYNKGDIKVSDSTRITIPKYMLNMDFGGTQDIMSKVKELETYDEGTSSVERGDFFKNFYNRDNLTGEQIQHIDIALNAYMKSPLIKEEGNEESGKIDGDELARTISFSDFLNNQDPSAKWYQIAGDTVVAAAEGIVYGLANAATSLESTFEGVRNLTTYVNPVWAIGKSVTGDPDFGKTTFAKETAEGIREWEKYRDKERQYENAALADLSSLMTFGVELVSNIYVGNVLGGAVSAEVANTILSSTSISKAATRVAAAQLGGGEISGAAAESAIQFATSEAQSLALLTGTRAALNLSDDAVGIIKNAIAIQKDYASMVGGAVDILTQAVVDAAMTDSTLMRRVLDGDTSGESYSYLMEQFAWNVGGWGAGLLAAKGMKALGSTKAGRKANAVVSKYINKLKSFVGDANYTIKSKVLREDLIQHIQSKADDAAQAGKARKTENLLKKAEIQEQRQKLRKVQKALGSSEISLINLSDDALKNAEKLMQNVREIEVSIDSLHRSLSYKLATYLNKNINSDIANANDDILDGIKKVLAVESPSKAGKVSSASIEVLSQESTNYLNYRFQASIMDIASEEKGKLAKSAAKYLPDYEKAVQLFKDTHSAELVAALDDLLGRYKKFYDVMNVYAFDKGVKNMAAIGEYADNPIFNGKFGYVRTQHLRDPEYKFQRIDGRVQNKNIYDVQHYKFGPVDDFVDLEVVRYQHMYDMAAAERSQGFVSQLFNSGAAQKQVLIGGDMTEQLRKAKGAKKALNEAANSHASYVGSSFDIPLPNKAAKTKPTRVYQSDRMGVIQGFSGSESRMALKELGYTGGSVFDDISRTVDAVDDINAAFATYVDGFEPNVRNYLRETIEKNGGGLDYDTFLRTRESLGDEFEHQFNRVFLSNDEGFRNSDEIKRLAAERKKAQNEFIQSQTKGIDNAAFKKSFQEQSGKAIDDYVEEMRKEWSQKKMTSAFTDVNAGVDADTISEYIALSELKKPKNQKAAHKSIEAEIDAAVEGKGISSDDVKKMKQSANSAYDKTLEERFNDKRNLLNEAGSSMVDTDDYYDEIRAIQKEITGVEADETVIIIQNQNGQYEYVKTDPVTADLYNYRPAINSDPGLVARGNAMLSKVFRFGTTTANLKSVANQYFRDTGNAIIVGNAFQLFKSCADDLVEVYGENIIEQLRMFDPYGLKQVERIASETGEDLAEVAVRREMAIGEAISPASTEVELYTNLHKNLYNRKGGKNTIEGINEATDKILGILEKPNSVREEYLRKTVYANNFSEAIKRGYTLKDARVFAEFAMNNATTNFGRQLYHLRSIASSTPYFSAAINGTTSFWRMFSLDPVGISGRMMGGLILPTMGLVGASLADEKSREAYMNVPEYAKQDSLVFAIRGRVYSIPIPQELSAMVAPFRQFVEYLYGANKNDFWELMLNDTLGFSPIDLQGFSTIDMNAMLAEDGRFDIFDRLSRGTARVFSQLAPVPVKGAYMLATGTDPYTGKKLRSTEYAYEDEESGQVVLMDYNQGVLAEGLAKFFKFGNAAIMGKVLTSVFGQAGSDVLESIAGAVQLISTGGEKGSEFFTGVAERQLSGVADVFYTDNYSQTYSAWRQAIAQLQEEKDALMADEVYKQVLNRLQQEQDPDKREKLLAQYRNMLDPFYDKVKTMVNNLTTIYGGSFDRYKFASVLSLMNFDNGTGFAATDSYLQQLGSSGYFAGKNAATRTLQQLGVSGTTDLSIFGYLKKDSDGNVRIVYSTPVAILDAQNMVYGAGDIDTANINVLLTSGTTSLEDEKKKMEAQVRAIRDKGKLSQADYNKIDALYMEFNNRVLAKLAPYIEKVSPSAILNNGEIMDTLEDYIKVPSAYEKIKGRYVSSDGGKLNKQQGFVRSYIKKLLED